MPISFYIFVVVLPNPFRGLSTPQGLDQRSIFVVVDPVAISRSQDRSVLISRSRIRSKRRDSADFWITHVCSKLGLFFISM